MRLEASKVLAKARLGIDVVAEAEAKASASENAVTLGDLVPKYLKAREGDMREKSLIETTRYLAGTSTNKDGKAKERTPSAFKPLYKLPIAIITRRDIKPS